MSSKNHAMNIWIHEYGLFNMKLSEIIFNSPPNAKKIDIFVKYS